jgi:hypothetical protein
MTRSHEWDVMSDDGPLKAQVREAMEAGTLPKRFPDELWGGPATGAPCAVCGTLTAPDDVELEFTFTRDPQQSKYIAHPRCFAIFTRELEELLGQTARSGSVS